MCLTTILDYITLKPFRTCPAFRRGLTTILDYITLKREPKGVAMLERLTTILDYITLKRSLRPSLRPWSLTTILDYITLKPQILILTLRLSASNKDTITYPNPKQQKNYIIYLLYDTKIFIQYQIIFIIPPFRNLVFYHQDIYLFIFCKFM